MPPLQRRALGRCAMRPKALGLGGAALGYGSVGDQDAIDTVERALALGIDFFDTSPLYGHSERRYGLALRGVPRSSYYLQTKVGTHPRHRKVYSADVTRWSIDNSLSLLGVDTLDSVLIHDPPDIEDPLGEGRCLDALFALKRQGVIRHIGLGCRDHASHLRAMETGRIDLVLTFLDYTLLNQSAACDTLPEARTRGVGVILGGALAHATLAGPDPRQTPHADRVDIERATALWQWCEQRGYSVRDFALRFALNAPAESITLVGAASPAEAQAAYDSATRDIPEPLWTEFAETFGLPR